MNIQVSREPNNHGSYLEGWVDPRDLKKRVRKMGKRLIETHGKRIEENPYLRFVAVTSTDKRPTDAMIFHSEDGINWVAQPGLVEGIEDFPQFYPQEFNRGAERLDGDDAVSNNLSRNCALLRLGVGPIDYGVSGSLQEMVDRELDELREEIGSIYVNGAQRDEGKIGREATLITINRTIDEITAPVASQSEKYDPSAQTTEEVKHSYLRDMDAANELSVDYELFLARKRYPFLRDLHPLGDGHNETEMERRRRKAGFWADACGLPRDAHLKEIYGRLVAISKGHPIFGDDKFEQLSVLLQECLERGQHVVLLGDRLFVRHNGRWKAARRDEEGQPTWTEGVVRSNNHGRLIVPPFYRDGELQDGYTRNSAGEGKSKPRSEAVVWKVAHRELAPSDLAWVHALHEWDLDQD